MSNVRKSLKSVPIAALYASEILSGCQESTPMSSAKPSMPFEEARLIAIMI